MSCTKTIVSIPENVSIAVEGRIQFEFLQFQALLVFDSKLNVVVAYDFTLMGSLIAERNW